MSLYAQIAKERRELRQLVDAATELARKADAHYDETGAHIAVAKAEWERGYAAGLRRGCDGLHRLENALVHALAEVLGERVR